MSVNSWASQTKRGDEGIEMAMDIPGLDEVSGGSGETEEDKDTGNDNVGVPEEALHSDEDRKISLGQTRG